MGDVCNRCLIMNDARVEYVATWNDKHERRQLPPTDPAGISRWYEEVMVASGGDALFSWADQSSCLTPVTTWHGDPVCAPHLWELRDRELRRR